MKKKKNLMTCLLLVVMLYCATSARAEMYVTAKGFEADKLASIWLIKRFIDSQATFRFIEQGEKIHAGVAFDLPEAKLRRTHSRAAYETILQAYDLQDKNLKLLGLIIHDMEINTWAEKKFPQTAVVQEKLQDIVASAGDDNEIIKQSCTYLDGLYQELAASR